MASTGTPAAVRARAACSPVRMLTSCSGEGPPKMTAGWLMARSSGSLRSLSGVVVGQIVLVEDDIAGSEMLLYPRDGLISRLDQHDLAPAGFRPGGAGLERLAVGVSHDHQVGGDRGDPFG